MKICKIKYQLFTDCLCGVAYLLFFSRRLQALKSFFKVMSALLDQSKMVALF